MSDCSISDASSHCGRTDRILAAALASTLVQPEDAEALEESGDEDISRQTRLIPYVSTPLLDAATSHDSKDALQAIERAFAEQRQSEQLAEIQLIRLRRRLTYGALGTSNPYTRDNAVSPCIEGDGDDLEDDGDLPDLVDD